MGLPKYEGMPGSLGVGSIRTLPSPRWKRAYKREWHKRLRTADEIVVAQALEEHYGSP